jgi:hypothetical protein
MKLRLLVIAAPVVVLLLAGCAGAAVSIARATHPGMPAGFDTATNLMNGKPGAIWISNDRSAFAIVTYGSSTCTPIPTTISSPNAHVVEVTFVKAPSGACSADQAAVTHEFVVPKGVDSGSPVTLHITYDFEQKYQYTLSLG